MYSTDGKINMKNNLIDSKDKKEEDNNYNSKIKDNNNEKNLKNQMSLSLNDNNMLLNSQAKSLLSDYVEDLEVIKDKDFI